MSEIASSIPAALRQNAQQQPSAPAFTFTDYEFDPNGTSDTLTWSQAYGRVRVLAAEIARYGTPGDRVAIIAPQGLDYIVGFLAAMEAGRVAVPLSVPQGGSHDERVSAVIEDCAPAVILTTLAVSDDVASYAREDPAQAPIAVIEIDALDLDGPPPAVADSALAGTKIALLQYTSGSTRRPAGVMVTHRNIVANLEQVFSDYFEEYGGFPPADTSPVSWLPFYHDMGLLLGIFAPVAGCLHAHVISPMAFLQKPARWVQMLADNTKTFSAAPNFAFELAAKRTTDEDMDGRKLTDVLGIISGSERIHAATVRRFDDRFTGFGLPDSALLPSYGLAEATLYVASLAPGRVPETAWFDPEKLSAGHAERVSEGAGTELITYGPMRASMLRIVDPETHAEKQAGMLGEMWVHGDNVAAGYWRNTEATSHTFGGRITEPNPHTPHGPWLRTGDLGVMSEGELFIVGRIKDLLIVDGRNHYPDDIEATVQELTGGRAVAISVTRNETEQLVVVAEVKGRGDTEEEIQSRFDRIKRDLVSAISRVHSVRVSDVMLVGPGSLPITTSGKVRRASCAEYYGRGAFSRLDLSE
ncbi:AMP-binding protein [Mycolicibacterium sediminis]|uniref:Long-chain-fatty-acid--AMP ligase FadD26 n=1 Tax=Mycolicibacterium sediminis TaxID=1286180 RepID=A0A7I7QT71_9MYCO|nr:AMP-binding protein [Mycolicibacterium sediminis]BBY29240.1 long-chain-fatty-acid--AMP ligase FadD26 [Mycolicibacterium sediminis]